MGEALIFRLRIWQGIYMRPSERHLRAPPRCSHCVPIVKANEAHLFPAGVRSDLTTPPASNPSLANRTQCHRRMTNELRNRPPVTNPAKNSKSLCWNVLKMHGECSWPVKKQDDKFQRTQYGLRYSLKLIRNTVWCLLASNWVWHQAYWL